MSIIRFAFLSEYPECKWKVDGGRSARVLAGGPGGEKGQVHCDLNFAVKQLTKKEFKKKELCQVR